MIRVMVHPADDGGCGRYRLIWPAQAAAATRYDRDRGLQVRCDRGGTYRGQWTTNAYGQERLIGLDERVAADVVVLQRPLHRHRYELAAALQAQGVAVVVEVDDDFHTVHPLNPAWKSTGPLHDSDHNRDWLMRSCEIADLVTVSTPALAERYGAHGRVRIIPNCVPARYLGITAGEYSARYLTDDDPRTMVGWSGSVATHPGDLETTAGGVAAAVETMGARFGVVGTGKRVRDALALSEEPAAAGWLPITAYPEALARFDVGIVPLLPTAFNEAKSWLKGLEFAAVGVPFVATPTGEYRRLADLGAGELASTPEEWCDQLARLIGDDRWRAERAEEGLEVAYAWTIEGNLDRWTDAWAEAARVRAERSAA